MSLTDTRAQSGATVLEPDPEVARRYLEAASLLEAELGVKNDLPATRLLTLPGVMVPVKEDTAETIRDVGHIGRVGMQPTDEEIVKLMIE